LGNRERRGKKPVVIELQKDPKSRITQKKATPLISSQQQQKKKKKKESGWEGGDEPD